MVNGFGAQCQLVYKAFQFLFRKANILFPEMLTYDGMLVGQNGTCNWFSVLRIQPLNF